MVLLSDAVYASLRVLRNATAWMLDKLKADGKEASSLTTPYLYLFGDVIGGHLMIKGVLTPGGPNLDGMTGANAVWVCLFFACSVLALSDAKAAQIMSVSSSILDSLESVFGVTGGLNAGH